MDEDADNVMFFSRTFTNHDYLMKINSIPAYTIKACLGATCVDRGAHALSKQLLGAVFGYLPTEFRY